MNNKAQVKLPFDVKKNTPHNTNVCLTGTMKREYSLSMACSHDPLQVR